VAAKAEPAVEPEAVTAESPAAADGAGDEATDAPPEPMNRAERRALAKRKGAPVPVGKVKQIGHAGPPAAHTPRHWQGRRGG
jgi:hypothetical protein